MADNIIRPEVARHLAEQRKYDAKVREHMRRMESVYRGEDCGNSHFSFGEDTLNPARWATANWELNDAEKAAWEEYAQESQDLHSFDD